MKGSLIELSPGPGAVKSLIIPLDVALLRYFQAWNAWSWDRMKRALALRGEHFRSNFTGKLDGRRVLFKDRDGYWKCNDQRWKHYSWHVRYSDMPPEGIERMRQVAWRIRLVDETVDEADSAESDQP